MLPFSVSARKFGAAIAIGVLAVLIALAAGATSPLRRFENTSYDLRVALEATPLSPSSPIVIVDINESTVRALAPIVGRWPWPRAVHASAIDYLAKSGAKVIAYDVLFGEHEGRSETTINGQAITGADSDRALVESVRSAGNVILLSDAVYNGLAKGDDAPAPVLPGTAYSPGQGFEQVPQLQLPFDDLKGAVRGVGHNRLVRDFGSDFARRMLPFVDVKGVAVPSLGMAAALAFLDVAPERVTLAGDTLRVGEASIPLLADPVEAGDGTRLPSRQELLRYRAPTPGPDGVTSMFPGYSFYDVLLSADQQASGKTPAIPPSAFAGKLVFVGTSASGLYDRYLTPFKQGAGGVELHATLADNVLSRWFMRRASPAADRSAVIVAGVSASAAAVFLPVGVATAVVVALAAGYVWLASVTIGHGLWLALVAPLLASAVGLFGGVAWQYFVEGREKREIKRLFGRYVSKDVIEQLMADPALANLGGQRREMTVLFSDIRGFTTASEAGTPEAIVDQLNEYFGAMVEVLFRHRGTLDKFVGDMVMGLFGAPLADPAHADHAVAAALEMTEALNALNAKWKTEGRPILDIGIGINSGEMIAGNIGAETAMSYTVIGDAVNLGSRLESLNKDYGTRLLISEETRARLTLPVQTRVIGEVNVKGRKQAVLVHEVTGYSK
jgi:adenylate cyclase